jgi:serine/threonine protein kinase
MLHPEYAQWLVHQLTVSRTQILSAPQIQLRGEAVPIGSRFAVMNLTVPPMASREESVLFYAKSNPFDRSVRAIVKYQTDCMERRRRNSSIHPLLREYFILKYITERSGVHIVPKPFFVSPPSLMGVEKTQKTDFTLAEDMRVFCARSHVRYLVMERGGISMEDLISFVPNYTLPFYDSMNVLKQLLIALREIHRMGIIHGDIHRGNVVRSLADGEKILLIDFGLARIVDAKNPLPEFRIRPPLSMSVRLHFTHWQYEGFMPSFRDDVLSSIALAAYSTGGLDYLRSLNDAEADQDMDYFYRLFSTNDMFTVAGTQESIIDTQLGYLAESSRSFIKSQLNNLLAITRSIDLVNAMPPHDILIALVDDIIAHL